MFATCYCYFETFNSNMHFPVNYESRKLISDEFLLVLNENLCSPIFILIDFIPNFPILICIPPAALRCPYSKIQTPNNVISV